MTDVYICDIPVYRCAEDAYYAEMHQGLARYLDSLFATSRVPREKVPESYRNAEEHFRSTFGGPWTFNQVVGWIRLYSAGSHIGAHLWWVTAKRLQRKMRKTFYLTTSSDILGTYFTQEDSSERIFEETRAKELGSGLYFKFTNDLLLSLGRQEKRRNRVTGESEKEQPFLLVAGCYE